MCSINFCLLDFRIAYLMFFSFFRLLLLYCLVLPGVFVRGIGMEGLCHVPECGHFLFASLPSVSSL